MPRRINPSRKRYRTPRQHRQDQLGQGLHPLILLILGAAVLVGGLLMGGSPAVLEEETEETTEVPEEQ